MTDPTQPLDLERMREAMDHELKTWPAPFQAVKSGAKPFEYRRHDRDYRVGDTLWLREWEPESGAYTGDDLRQRITFLLPGGMFGVPEGYCVMGLSGLLDALSSERAAREDAEGEVCAGACKWLEVVITQDMQAQYDEGRAAQIVESWKARALAAEAQVSALQAQVDGLRDVGVLQEALERAWKDCGAMAPHPSPSVINIIGRHMAHHIPEVVREFSQPPADEANGT